MSQRRGIGAVLVVGGGVSGIQAALDLAECGVKVYLLERAPAIGGKMAQLDKTFPTNDCAMCILSPKLVECGRHPNIEIITNAELLSVEGEAGNFLARIFRHPTYVEDALCNGCGACEVACIYRNRVPSQFNEGLGKRSAIYILYPQAVPLKAVVDPQSCLMVKNRKCTLDCVKACLVKAINFDQKEARRELQVGAVILSLGYQAYDARLSPELGFGRYPNVVTSLQFERLLSASGPTEGHIGRPSEGREPKRIAFLQCVGSRDQKHPYCSSVCCMYTAKEAMLAQEHIPGVEAEVFFMDVRAFGKGFDAYYERARSRGVKYTRCRLSSIKEMPQTKNLLLRYFGEEGEVREAEFDLVVLAVGMEPPEGAREMAARLGIALRGDGFCHTGPFLPVETTRPGIFVCGAFTEPKDIPDSIIQGGGAVGQALRLVSRGTLVEKRAYPAEIKIDEAPPRIGVFVCHCGFNIAGVVDVAAVTDFARSLPNVVHAEHLLYSCSADSLESIAQRVAEKELNRVVVAACSPRTHEPIFRDTLRQAGLNAYLFEMANIRDQCSWVHSEEPEKATEKSKALVRMGVARASLLQPLYTTSLGLSHDALVIGGGVAGMTAALTLADQGFKVYLVEREKELGGQVRRLHSTAQGADPKEYLASLVAKVERNDLIEVLLETSVVKFSGFPGNFKTTVASGPRQRLLEHGAVILATGAQEYRDGVFSLGQEERVLTLGDLEERLSHSPEEVAKAEKVVFLLCVGPGGLGTGTCSRICCTVAIKNALKIKELNPKAQVYILYKEIRTYGFKEELYTQAREKGVIFLRYWEGNLPRVEASGGRMAVSLREPVLGEVALSPDLLVLATAIVPSVGKESLAHMLKVPLTPEGFFLEAHIKLRPVDFAAGGLFLCGAAHYPKFIEETIAQAGAAASRAATLLSKERLEVGGPVALVDPEKCSACLTCIRVCPYGAPALNEDQVAEISVVKCQGCGICVAECPAKAIQLLHYKEDQVTAKAEALLIGI